jgi:hypothetical protein
MAVSFFLVIWVSSSTLPLTGSICCLTYFLVAHPEASVRMRIPINAAVKNLFFFVNMFPSFLVFVKCFLAAGFPASKYMKYGYTPKVAPEIGNCYPQSTIIPHPIQTKKSLLHKKMAEHETARKRYSRFLPKIQATNTPTR